jgi:hypothetical protein
MSDQEMTETLGNILTEDKMCCVCGFRHDGIIQGWTKGM